MQAYRDQARRIRGEQEIIVNHAPQQAFETLPRLLAEPDDRTRFISLFDRLLADVRLQATRPTPDQQAMLERMRILLQPQAGRGPGVAPRAVAANDAPFSAPRSRRPPPAPSC